MINLAVFISGGGTNLQALIDAQNNGSLKSATIKLVVSNVKTAYGLKRAEENKIPTYVWDTSDEKNLLNLLDEYSIDLIILAGFLKIIGPGLLEEYKDRIINVHPSLLPAFSGKGFYGLKVHEAALERGVKITGASVHFVNEIIDGGEIILQKAVKVKSKDTARSLQERVMKEAEWLILPEAVESISAIISKKGEKK